MQRATLSARPSSTPSSSLSSSSMASSSPLSSRRIASAQQRPAAALLSTFTTRGAVGVSVPRHQCARRAGLKVSASASDHRSSSSSSSAAAAPSSTSSCSSSAAASLAAASSQQPLALAAVGVLGAASTAPFGSALFASIGGGGGGWWKGGGGGGNGGGGDGNNNGGGGGGGSNNLNPSVSDLAAASKDNDDDDDESGSEYEEVEEEDEDEASAKAGEEDEQEEEDDEGEEDEAASRKQKSRRRSRSGRPAAGGSSSDAPDAFFLAKLTASGLPKGAGVPTEEEIFGEGDLTPGFTSTKSAVAAEIRRLLATGMFASVNARATQVPGRPKGECELEFEFKEKELPPLRSFRVVSPSSKSGPAIPFSEVQKVMEKVGGETGIRRLAVMREVVDGWYDRHGYAPQCRVARFDGLDSGDVVAVVDEPRVNRLRVVPVDDYWQPFSVPKAERERAAGMQESANSGVATPPSTVARDLHYFKKGSPVNMGVDGRKAMRDLMALGIYDNCQVQLKDVPAPPGSSSSSSSAADRGDDDDGGDEAGGEGGSSRRSGSSKRKQDQLAQMGPQLVDVEILVHERPHKTVEHEFEWQIAPGGDGQGGAGKPSIVSWLPGGSLLFEDRNVLNKGITASASLSSASLCSPSPEELGFRVDVKVPFVFGLDDPKKSAVTLAAFNSRRLSPVFAAVPGSGDEVPPVMLDRVGAKLSLAETYSRNSRGSLGVVVERVAAVDENGAPAPRGTKQLASTGALAPHGPPTTLSGEGTDVLAYLQGSVVRDATWDCAGQTLGPRDAAVVDQGLGIGPASPIFNRATVSMTRHLRLPSSLFGGKLPLLLPERLAPRPSLAGPRPPASLVLHARGGAAVGALPSYEAFVLGGPHSARGFGVGELGAARRFAEAAVELRVPVCKATAFAFVEGATDLGSGAEVRGNPTAFYRRAGAGTSAGVGAKMGAARLEYATDSNSGRGTFFMRYGERF